MFRAAILALALSATPAFAAPLFHAQPDATPSNTKFVLRDTLWKCGDTGCAAAQGTSRPAVICAVLAKQVGTLRSFSFKGEEISAEELDKCNARAKKLLPEQVRTAARP
jgi:hypothetical protein